MACTACGQGAAARRTAEQLLICICNRLTDTMINEAVANGARTQADVLRRYHLHRGCSSCTVEVANAIERARNPAPAKAGD